MLVRAAVLAFALPVWASAQTFTDYLIPNGSGSANITAGPDGNLWFVENSNVGRVTPQGAITLFPLPSPFTNHGIVSGPDGNLWFTETQIGTIGRVTPQGAITEFPILPGAFPPPQPPDITAGPDGNLWFTENAFEFHGSVYGAIGKVCRMTTAGAITEFPVTPFDTAFTHVTDLSGITVGPDDGLWFLKKGENAVGRITTSGVASAFAIPTPGANPAAITTGPDGNLWFTESYAGKIGRITPSGVITEFTVHPGGEPVFGLYVNDITTGPDGNLWFTEFLGVAIARITTAGVITEFPLPTYGAPYGITTGPDGSLWFTAQSTQDRIVKFMPPLPPTPTPLLFVPLPPCRVLDTRSATAPLGGPALGAASIRTFTLVGACGIPAAAAALSGNLTVTDATAAGEVSAFPADVAWPGTNIVSFAPSQTRAAGFVLGLATDGSGALTIRNGASGQVHVILDVNGYFQ